MTLHRKGCKDVWNAHMCSGAKYAKYDIPKCPTIVTDLPKEIITWEEAKQLHKKLVRQNANYHSDAFICFYIDDYKFDGVRTSIWLFPWLALRILKHYRGIITPDFSLYQDLYREYPLLRHPLRNVQKHLRRKQDLKQHRLQQKLKKIFRRCNHQCKKNPDTQDYLQAGLFRL